jgi:hypothetical protein
MVWLGHPRRKGLRARRGHPASRPGGKAEEEAVQGRLWDVTYHSLGEARDVYQKGAARLIIGAGQYGAVELSDEAAAYFEHNSCQIELLPMPR